MTCAMKIMSEIRLSWSLYCFYFVKCMLCIIRCTWGGFFYYDSFNFEGKTKKIIKNLWNFVYECAFRGVYWRCKSQLGM